MRVDPAVLIELMKEMLKWRAPEAIVQIYLNALFVNVNIMTLFYLNGCERELAPNMSPDLELAYFR
ncbi:hypothetical protein POSPLADRAFT_1062526 [Postia placenta MAD-698-R-SB12]|uniref:Uncharacterized protein n=1 Tax=Postia placenta MAD-698-R-SB12 TaxID=670580 RepID=A0A1X6MKC9_9APHY|nr:hypothetical protein POSPLADRAFT_1062526 [Postia placenta MAD-698-R-SB12]OSX56706.1 hypothetical protein POSPLADRAFT_1062526 [Postia placenta MAD-698-R-SB12]